MKHIVGITVAAIVLAATPGAPARAGAATDTPTADRKAYFGDLHLHTSYSFDAHVMFASRVTPEQAYRFAKGEPTPFLDKTVKRAEPLDFLAVTDHSENIGVFRDLDDPNSDFSKSDLGQRIRTQGAKAFWDVVKLQHGFSHRHVEWVDLPSGAETAALMDGTVDAIYVTGLRGIQYVRASGARTVFNATEHQDRWVRTHTAMLGALTVDEQPPGQSRESVENSLDSFRSAISWAATNSQQFLSQMGARFRTPAEDLLLAYGRRLTSAPDLRSDGRGAADPG